MSIEQYLVPVTGRKTNICFDCRRACGGCSWSELDPDTGKPRFQPVPGWTAKPVRLNIGTTTCGRVMVDTYHITACPLFSDDTVGRMTAQDSTDKYYLSGRTFY